MAKLTFVFFSVLILQVLSMEQKGNAKIEEPAETRGLLFNNIRNKLKLDCLNTLNKPSAVIPGLAVTLTKLANQRLYFFSPINTKVPFDTANSFCKEHGMHLVTINNEIENSLVFTRAVTLGMTGVAATPGAWIGMRDVTGTNVFKWIQRNVGQTPSVFFSTFTTATQCVSYLNGVVTDHTISWVSLDCAGIAPFICEVELPCSTVLHAAINA